MLPISRLSTAVIEANYDWVLVRLDAGNGLYGLGEAYMGPGVVAILQEMASLVVGMDATRPEVLVRRLRAHTIHAAPGVVWHAIAGIETACLDLLGKHLNLPICDLLGGACRTSVPVYADCHAGEALDSLSALLQPRQPSWIGSPDAGATGPTSLKHHGWDKTDASLPTVDDYRNRAKEMVARGFRALKFDADIPTPFPSDEYDRTLSRAEIEYVVERLSAVREAIGPHTAFAVDCHWNYNAADAKKLIKALEPLDLLWVEDPIPPDSIEQLAELHFTNTAIATGENHYLTADFTALLRNGKVRILAPDVQKIGPLHTREIGRIADTHAASIAVHNISSPIGFMAAAHVAAATPNFLFLEWHGSSVPFFDSLVNEGPVIQNGSVAIPDRPGLGLTLNHEVAERFSKPGHPVF